MIKPTDRWSLPRDYTCYRHPKFLVQQHYANKLVIDVVVPFREKYYEIMLVPEEDWAWIVELKYKGDRCDLMWVRISNSTIELSTCTNITPDNVEDKLSLYLTFS